jgi:electron transport complex protein RnfD
MATAAVSELLYRKLLKKKSTIGDGSALLTGLLLAFNLPPTAPIFIPILGSVIAIVLAKQLFGGLGCNIFNPALVARAILFVSFPTALSTWKAPSAIVQADAISAATPLSMLKVDGMDKLIDAFGGLNRLYQQLLIGQHAGSLGETCVLALAIGGIFLLIRGIITWHIPVSFLGTAALLAWIFGGSTGLFTGNPLIHILSGGIVLGAFFMATDYVTAPMLGPARLLFGAGCGCITMLIRLKGGYPEGVMFSILIMNCFAPLLDRIFRDPGFGAAARKEAAR